MLSPLPLPPLPRQFWLAFLDATTRRAKTRRNARRKRCKKIGQESLSLRGSFHRCSGNQAEEQIKIGNTKYMYEEGAEEDDLSGYAVAFVVLVLGVIPFFQVVRTFDFLFFFLS